MRIHGDAGSCRYQYGVSRSAPTLETVQRCVPGELTPPHKSCSRLDAAVRRSAGHWQLRPHYMSLRAGKRAAAIMSLLHSARINGHDPYAYFKDVLDCLPTHPASRIDELLPHRWSPS